MPEHRVLVFVVRGDVEDRETERAASDVALGSWHALLIPTSELTRGRENAKNSRF